MPSDKATHNAYMRRYSKRPEVRAARKAYMSQWRKDNRKKVLEDSRAYHVANRDRLNEARRQHTVKYPGMYREYHWREQGIRSKDGRILVYAVYLEILQAQGGICAICGSPLTARNGHPDHNHKTGVVRGVLCKRCNCSLGLMKDNPVFLRTAADYLERHG